MSTYPVISAAVLSIAFIRNEAGGMIHIATGMRPYCGDLLSSARVVDVADYEAICPACANVVKRLAWLVDGTSGGEMRG
jgi:hypothetical protein